VLPWQAFVGESPVWNIEEQCLYWVDIQNKQIHRFDPWSGRNQTFLQPEIVTCIALRAGGGLVLTLKKHFAIFDPATLRLERIGAVECDLPDNRFNDGECDPQGRFWAGTMDAVDWSAPAGNLYRLDADRTVTRMQQNVICSNGIAWSPDGRKIYHTESFRHAIFVSDFEPETGASSNRRPFATLDSNSDAFPDGLTVDADGFVWSNVVGPGQIRRYDPQGKIERILQLPVPRATDCTFGGPDLKTLYVTSARETMTAEQLAAAPLSGSLFAVDVEVRGLPASRFLG
jgi:sugar lactone lactonase YvrE